LKRVLDYNPYTGITTTFDYDPVTEMTIIGRESDPTAYIEYGKDLQKNEDYSKEGIRKGWWHYGILPPIIIEKWKNEFGVDVFNKDHEKAVFRLLNQPEYRYLKTTTKMHRG